MMDHTPYTVPKEPGRWRAIGLAVLVHLALFAFLWIGVRWQSNTPTTIEAEVWSPEPHQAAPVAPPVKQPVAPPAPAEPAPPPPPVKAAPQPEAKEPPLENPDIALEREKKRKAEQEKTRLEQERQAKLKQKAEEERQAKLKQQAEEERQAKLRQKAEEERQAKLKKAEEEKLAKQKAEQERIAKEKAARKAAEEARRKQEEAQMAQARAAEMKRITSGVTGTGGTGDAPKTSGVRGDGSYAKRVEAKIKSNIVFNLPEGMTNNPAVEYEVDLLPDGSIAGIRKLKPSGLPGWDEAVLRAIQKSQPFPKDKSGSVPSSFTGIHRPKDQ